MPQFNGLQLRRNPASRTQPRSKEKEKKNWRRAHARRRESKTLYRLTFVEKYRQNTWRDTLMELERFAILPQESLTSPHNRSAVSQIQSKPRMYADSSARLQDAELIREAQKGSRAAFDVLVRQYDQAVLRLALHLTGSEQDAQDIHQEAFLKAYRHIGSFRFECSFYTWIYRIVTNLCLRSTAPTQDAAGRPFRDRRRHRGRARYDDQRLG